ncbi:MAG: sigma-54-dependent transcriptional regulator [Candidatus Cyclobacteriaceae bacterium M2_1C_046]
MVNDEHTRIFIVEDDPTYAKFLEYVMNLNPDYETKVFSSGKECLDNLTKNPQIITLDYSLPDMSGEDVLKKIRTYDPNISVIIISAQEKIRTAVELLKLGAYDYIAKDEDTKDRLLNAVKNAKNKISLVKEIDSLRKEISEKYDFEKSIIGNSTAIKSVFQLMEKAIKTNITVSITGETGTGKELIAKAIHYNSPKKKNPFIAVNIAAIPSELIESELFGHEKGAFTGAVTRRIGKFEEAHGGTIFLDEIGEMDINLQAKLLRVLQEREVTRVGGNEVVSVEVRVIVATHKKLAEEVKNGNFREDLYYRLLGLPIHLPPLRERDNDVLIIAKHFLKTFSKENNLPGGRLTEEAQKKLLKYPFPGNIRELKSVIDLAAVMSDNSDITEEDISFSHISRENSLMMEEMSLREYTFKIIRFYLDKYNDNVIKVAEKLDIGKSTIYRYLKEMEAEEL